LGKIFPLINSSLKGFIRNRRAVFLLVIFPLILISVVFFSFNPDGLRKVPIGIVSVNNDFDVSELKRVLSSFSSTSDYNTIEDCIKDLKKYNQYTCIEILKQNSYIFNVYFDNTQESIIWEIIQRIKTNVDLLQKERTKEMASDFLEKFSLTMNKLDIFKVNLKQTNSELDSYIYEIDGSIEKLKTSKKDISDTINEMDQDIYEMKTLKSNYEAQKNNYYSSIMFKLDEIEALVGSSETAGLRNEINSYNSFAGNYFNEMDSRISKYEIASEKGKNYISEIDSTITKMENTKKDLYLYKSKLDKTENEITNIQNYFKGVGELDPETMVNPIVIYNKPVYIPEVEAEIKNLNGEKAERGFNMISLQTIYPNILFLIVLFLSLLISSFVCLSEINSPANQRIKLIKGISIPEIISIYTTSLIIIALPIFCVLLFGNILFVINIFKNFVFVSIILFLISSIFIIFEISLAYLIKKKSITLLITTFILVFLIFFSGFLLPIERMSKIAGYIASIFPMKVALSAFNKIVFYNEWNSSITNIVILGIWFAILIPVSLIIKKIKQV